jgi:hypothetical protein
MEQIQYTFGKAAQFDLSRLVYDDNGSPIVGFAGLNYTNGHGEHANNTIIIGVSYDNVLEKSRKQLIAKMQIDLGLNVIADDAKNDDGLFTIHAERIVTMDYAKTDDTTRAAASELLLSIYNSINNRKQGKANDAYTKAETYTALFHGIKVHKENETLELSGLAYRKRIITEGDYPVVNSRPKTIAKARLRNALPLGKWRTYRLDKAHTIRRSGDTLFFGETEKEIETMIQHRSFRLLTEPADKNTLIK